MSQSDFQFDDSFVITAPRGPADVTAVLGTLNALYLAESCSFFRYMDTWSPWTDVRTIKLRTAVRDMARASYGHADRISHLMESLGASPTPGSFRKSDADANYADWSTLLPRLIDAKRRMIIRCDEAIKSLQASHGAEQAVELITALRAEHQSHLDTLRSWAASFPRPQ